MALLLCSDGLVDLYEDQDLEEEHYLRRWAAMIGEVINQPPSPPSASRSSAASSAGHTALDRNGSRRNIAVHLLRDYACEHAGIVCLPTLVASDAVCSGHLKIVLPDHQLSSFWLSAVYAKTLRGAFKLRLFIESLGSSFGGGEPPWDKALIERGLILPELLED